MLNHVGTCFFEFCVSVTPKGTLCLPFHFKRPIQHNPRLSTLIHFQSLFFRYQ
jgi:hypothetical protein